VSEKSFAGVLYIAYSSEVTTQYSAMRN